MSLYQHQIRHAPEGQSTSLDLPALPLNRSGKIRGFLPSRYNILQPSHPLYSFESTRAIAQDGIVGIAFLEDITDTQLHPPTHFIIIAVGGFFDLYYAPITISSTNLGAPFGMVELGAPVHLGQPAIVAPDPPFGMRLSSVQYGRELFVSTEHYRYPVRIKLGTGSLPQMFRLGMDAPATPTVALNGAGALTGDYYYRDVNVDELGRESSPTQSAVISPAAQQVRVTVTWPSDTQVVSKNIYRNTAGQTKIFYKVGSITSTATTTFDDNMTDATAESGGTLGPELGQNDPPNPGSVFAVHKNRLCMNDRNWMVTTTDVDAKNRVQLSNIDAPTQFASVNSPDILTDGTKFQVASEEGDEITALSPFGSALIMFKRKAHYGLFGDTIADFQGRFLGTPGCVAPASVVQCGSYGLAFLAEDGPYLMTSIGAVQPMGKEVKNRFVGIVRAE